MMDEDELAAALRELNEKWEIRAKEAAAHSVKMRVGNTHHAYYYRGIADGYKAALADLRALTGEPTEASPEISAPETYINVSRETVLALLGRAGLAVADLHSHADFTFSAIFSPLQVLSFDDHIAKLTSAADIAVLDYGRLPNSSKAYVDFGFRSLPDQG
jgi:hypothetical protein